MKDLSDRRKVGKYIRRHAVLTHKRSGEPRGDGKLTNANTRGDGFNFARRHRQPRSIRERCHYIRRIILVASTARRKERLHWDDLTNCGTERAGVSLGIITQL